MPYAGSKMELELLKSLVVLFGASVLAAFLLSRLKIPTIVGFLVAGVIIGPCLLEEVTPPQESDQIFLMAIFLLC
jgi:CPA2 family monovalent cation:H+ antiporter-2